MGGECYPGLRWVEGGGSTGDIKKRYRKLWRGLGHSRIDHVQLDRPRLGALEGWVTRGVAHLRFGSLKE